MKITEALEKLRKEPGGSISARSLLMHRQTYDSLLFWLLIDEQATNGNKIETLIKILNADDWEYIEEGLNVL